MWDVACDIWAVASSMMALTACMHAGRHYSFCTGATWDVTYPMRDVTGEDRERRQGEKTGNEDMERRQGSKTGDEDRESGQGTKMGNEHGEPRLRTNAKNQD